MNTLKLDILPIEDDGFHIFISALINGKEARLLIDTGASRTVFDADRIRDFLPPGEHELEKIEKLSTGLGTNTMESHSVVLKEFILGETVLTDYIAIVLNMSHVNQSYQLLGEVPIDGVLGGDLLQKLKAVIDYRRRQIRWKE